MGVLGDEHEAQAVVRDAWELWLTLPADSNQCDGALLVALTMQMSLQRCRTDGSPRGLPSSGERRHEARLPAAAFTPGKALELADDLATMLMTMLERVSPEARAAFVLHDLFAADFPEVARLMGTSESACLDLVDQAKAQLLSDRPGRPTV